MVDRYEIETQYNVMDNERGSQVTVSHDDDSLGLIVIKQDDKEIVMEPGAQAALVARSVLKLSVEICKRDGIDVDTLGILAFGEDDVKS